MASKGNFIAVLKDGLLWEPETDRILLFPLAPENTGSVKVTNETSTATGKTPDEDAPMPDVDDEDAPVTSGSKKSYPGKFLKTC